MTVHFIELRYSRTTLRTIILRHQSLFQPYVSPTVRTSKSSPHHQNSPYLSHILEIPESPLKPVKQYEVAKDSIIGLITASVLNPDDEIVSIFYKKLPHGYPTPTLDQDDILEICHEDLSSRGIYTRGRFGSWKHEVSNQDTSFMLGLEAVDNSLMELLRLVSTLLM